MEEEGRGSDPGIPRARVRNDVLRLLLFLRSRQAAPLSFD